MGTKTESATAESDGVQLVQQYVDYLNSESWEKLAALFHDDAALYLHGKCLAQGREAIRASYERVPAGYPHHVLRPQEVVADDTVAFAHLVANITLQDGTESFSHVVDIFRFREGRLTEVRIVGMLPRASSASDDTPGVG